MGKYEEQAVKRQVCMRNIFFEKVSLGRFRGKMHKIEGGYFGKKTKS